MFKAVSEYDGSDTSKCISLCIGDVLSEVHALDDNWLIGYNQRSKETGAFPESCVQPMVSNLYTPVPAKRNVQPETSGTIYANVSSLVDGKTNVDNLDPVARARTLSNHVKTLDPERLKTGRQNEGSENDNEQGKNDDAPDKINTGTKSVHFETTALQHSISVPESMLSWQDSSFEQSLDDRVDDKATDTNNEHINLEDKGTDGKYHKLKREKLRDIMSSTERIFHSGKTENKRLKALFGTIAGFMIGALLYPVLVFSFGYSYTAAGIIDAISTIFFILCLAFCPLCRCIMALVFPNFFTGKGRTVFLSIIFGVILSHPVTNINYNIQETSKSLACVTELAANQTLALQKQFAQPVAEVTEYVEKQKKELEQVSNSMKVAFGVIDTSLDELDKQVDGATKVILSVKDVSTVQIRYVDIGYVEILLKPFTNGEFWGGPIKTADSDDRIDADKERICIQKSQENIEAKGETAGYQQFLLLSPYFPKPVAEVTEYVEKQKKELEQVSNSMKVAFGVIDTSLDELDKQVDGATKVILSVKDECRKPFIEGRNKCVDTCNKIFNFLNEPCSKSCIEIQNLASVCDSLDEAGTKLTESARKTRSEVENGLRYFQVDLEVSSEFSGEVNKSKSYQGIQEEVSQEVGTIFNGFKTFIFILKIILSLSLALIFFQSFWYLRNYLAKDAYDNIYITSQFKKMDQESMDRGMEALLPLKKKEQSVYVDTNSCKLNSAELVHCRVGLAQVFLHFIVCIMVLLFDFSLYFILKLIQKNGDIEIEFQGEGRFKVQVKGNGPVADFYKIMIQGFNLDQTYSSSLDVGNCLPNPGEPSVAIIPALLILYLVSLAFVVLRGYGMRLRRKIAAYYYPEQEIQRLEYLHKKIRHKRVGFLKFLRHQIKSAQKENDVKERFRISAWLAFRFPALGKILPSRDKLECTSCEQKESGFHGIVLTKCPGNAGGMPCEAVYCQECRAALNNMCPLCSSDEVVLRE